MSSVRLALKNSLLIPKEEDGKATEPVQSASTSSASSSASHSTNNSSPQERSTIKNIQKNDDSIRGSSLRIAVRHSVKQHSIDEGYYNTHEEECAEAMNKKRIKAKADKEKRRLKRSHSAMNVNTFSPSLINGGNPLLLWDRLHRPPTPPPTPPPPLATVATYPHHTDQQSTSSASTSTSNPAGDSLTLSSAGASAIAGAGASVRTVYVPVQAGRFDVLPVEVVGLCLHYLGVRELCHLRGACRDLWRQVGAHSYRWQLTALCMCRSIHKPTSVGADAYCGVSGKHKSTDRLSKSMSKRKVRGDGKETGVVSGGGGALGVVVQVGMQTALEYRRSGIPARKWAHSHNEVCQVS